MTRPTVRSAGVALLFVALTVAMTWPQAARLGTHVYDNDDPLLSIWRLSWIAHILPTRPLDLFNGNIFHPEPRTLAFSDSVLLQGVAATPLIDLGASKVATYNAILLLSIALSGWAMWHYAALVTGSYSAALLAGIVFAFVPFRFDHLHHLELQATVFLPLTLLFFDRAIESHQSAGQPNRTKTHAWLMMAAFVAQVYSCIYYSVFLATALVPAALVRLWRATREQRAAFARAALAPIVVALIVSTPYVLMYSLNRQRLGDRLERDVIQYSASLGNYLAATPANIIYGASAVYGQGERYLFPGAVALVLAAVGVLAFDRRRATLAVIGICAFIISLGLNSPFYGVLREIVVPFCGLRAPARASILVFAALAAFSAFGWARLMRGRSMRTVAIATTVVAAALLAEYRTRLDRWLALPERPPAVYAWLAHQPRSVIAEVPFAQPDRLDRLFDGLYMYNSTWHWQPIVNGYSGYFPRTFIELTDRTATFPDDQSMAYLKSRGVDLIVLHESWMADGEFGEMTAKLERRPDVERVVGFREQMGSDLVYRLRR